MLFGVEPAGFAEHTVLETEPGLKSASLKAPACR